MTDSRLPFESAEDFLNPEIQSVFSIIVPTFNESAHIAHTLQTLIATIDNAALAQIIISDGGSSDDTLQRLQAFPVQCLQAARGRAAQMNAGAAQAEGDWLVFLHADTRLPPDWQTQIATSNALWGRFDVALDDRHRLLRVIEKAMNLRSCLSSIATGDQALFFRRDFFDRIGGFPDIPLMEDIAISKRAKQYARACCLPGRVVTSARRWRQNGILRTIILMWSLRLAYWLGVKPETLHRWYYPTDA